MNYFKCLNFFFIVSINLFFKKEKDIFNKPFINCSCHAARAHLEVQQKIPREFRVVVFIPNLVKNALLHIVVPYF